MAMGETNRTEYRAQKQPPTDVGLSYVHMSSVVCQHLTYDRAVNTDQCGGKSQADFSINAAGAVRPHEYQEARMVTGEPAAITPNWKSPKCPSKVKQIFKAVAYSNNETLHFGKNGHRMATGNKMDKFHGHNGRQKILQN